MERLRRMFHRTSGPVAHADSGMTAELHEREDLQAELDRHGAFIEAHIDEVAERVRTDAIAGDDRVRGR